jgi:hypothetical protein
VNKTAFIFILFLSPLAYSVDGDDYRAYEVIVVGLISLVFLSRAKLRSLPASLLAPVATYAFYLTIQQLFIPEDDLFFGFKFSVSTLLAFLPVLLIMNSQVRHENLLSAIRLGVLTLTWVALISIIIFPVFGLGEMYRNGLLGFRAFGFLGDSFSPVLIFLITDHFLQNNLITESLSISMVLIMGSKITLSLLVIILSALLFIGSGKISLMRITALFMLAVIIGLIVYESFSALELIDYSLNTRLYSIMVGLETFYENQLFGIGINKGLESTGNDTFALAQANIQDFLHEIEQIENTYIRVLTETGVIGFILISTIMIPIFFKVLTCVKQANYFPKSCERSFIIANGIFVLSIIFGYQTTGWFVAGHPQLVWLLVFAGLCFAVRYPVIRTWGRRA